MNNTNAAKPILVNLTYWLAAILVHPIARLLPTGTGETPKFFELLIPLFLIGLACGSTVLLKGAMQAPRQ